MAVALPTSWMVPSVKSVFGVWHEAQAVSLEAKELGAARELRAVADVERRGRRQRRDVCGERAQLDTADAFAVEPVEGDRHVLAQVLLGVVPRVRRRGGDAPGEQDRATRTGRGRPGDGVVASVGMAAGAGASVLGDAGVVGGVEERATEGHLRGQRVLRRRQGHADRRTSSSTSSTPSSATTCTWRSNCENTTIRRFVASTASPFGPPPTR